MENATDGPRPVLGDPALKLAVLLATALLLFCRSALAETIQAPVGGKPIALDGRVLCSTPVEWTASSDGATVRPPDTETSIGHAVDVRVAKSSSACTSESQALTLVATGHLPAIDASSVAAFVDEGRLELRGRNLKSIVVSWRSGARGGTDSCPSPQTEGTGERCAFAIAREVSTATTTFEWAPAGVRSGPDVTTYDANARRMEPGEFALRPSRFVIRSLVPAQAALDLAPGRVSSLTLLHPEAVAAVDCSTAECTFDGNRVDVRGLSAASGSLAIRVRLLPHVFLARGDKEENVSTASISVLPCATSILSGDVIRGVDDVRVLLQLDARCGNDPQLRFVSGGHPLDVVATSSDHGSQLVLLRAGRVEGAELVIAVVRQADGSSIGIARARTRAAPIPHAALELPARGPIDFIPNNRSAIVRTGSAGSEGRLVLLPAQDVYSISTDENGVRVRGAPNATGFVALRFGYRLDSLPGEFAKTDLAVLTEPALRPVHEANVPVEIGAAAFGTHPLVQVLCGDGVGGAQTILPGRTTHIPYAARDTCRVIIHRSRLDPELGAQRLELDVDVVRIDGSPRTDGRINEPIVLRAGDSDWFAWIHGVEGAFDRITVRLRHAADESHYTGPESRAAPSVQWSIVAGTAHARIYATTAIPTGLYRVSDRGHSGILTFNLGAVLRLTWLDGEGHEGFLGAEGGIMGLGLANDVDSSGHSLTQLAMVTGIGLSVPIANRSLATETSINLHAWFEYEVSRDLGGQPGSPFGFVFGPSISIGNIGANL